MRVRIAEGEGPQPFLLWDSVWDPAEGRADWALAGPAETLNRGGLRATAALHTAVVIALFTDRRVPDEHPLRWLAGDDPRGWWGDGVLAEGETELGSLLWLLERAPLTGTFDVPLHAKAFAEEALSPLVAQGVVVRAEVEAAAAELQSRLELVVRLYGRDGGRIYQQKFEVVWDQLRGA
jgi:phage gp46-like protein